MAGIRLIPLKCIQCEVQLPAQVDEVAWRCAACGAGQQLGEAGLRPLEINFAANNTGAAWQPYWAFDGSVTITRRYTQSGQSRGFDWGKIKRFWVPAYALDLKQAQAVATRLTQTQPAITAIAPPPNALVAGCVVLPDDARKLVEFIVLGLEAAQPDWLRDIDFALDLGQPALWMLPAQLHRKQ